MTDPEITILMPCLNEAETLSSCISKALLCLSRLEITGEILVADNGSSDCSNQIAFDMGVRCINVAEKGYGNALRAGLAAAKGKYIILGDADDSYDFLKLLPFIEKLREGYQLVIGNRFSGSIQSGAMPLLHRYLGNPFFSFLARVLFNTGIGDINCGLRALPREAVRTLAQQSLGMEFSAEMVVKAAILGLKITEVPISLSRDGRTRSPYLRTWRDGWQVLRYLLAAYWRAKFLYRNTNFLRSVEK